MRGSVSGGEDVNRSILQRLQGKDQKCPLDLALQGHWIEATNGFTKGWEQMSEQGRQ